MMQRRPFETVSGSGMPVRGVNVRDALQYASHEASHAGDSHQRGPIDARAALASPS